MALRAFKAVPDWQFKAVPDWQFKAVPEWQKRQGFERPQRQKNRSGLYCPKPFRNDSKQAVLNGSKMPVLEQCFMGPGERFSFLKVIF